MVPGDGVTLALNDDGGGGEASAGRELGTGAHRKGTEAEVGLLTWPGRLRQRGGRTRVVGMHLARGAGHVCYGGAAGPIVRHLDARALNMQDWVVETGGLVA
jgi:hypothetical protein